MIAYTIPTAPGPCCVTFTSCCATVSRLLLQHHIRTDFKSLRLLVRRLSLLLDHAGFGILGHLAEMLRSSGQRAELRLGALPLLDGAAECLAQGSLSSMHLQNAKVSSVVEKFGELEASSRLWPICMDPQTAGGLLAGVPPDQAPACLQALRSAGYGEAAIIGECRRQEDAGAVGSLVRVIA